MPRSRGEGRHQTLRRRLLTPIISLVVVALLVIAGSQELVSRRVTEDLVEQRGTAALAAVEQRVLDQVSDYEDFVRVLSREKGVAAALAERDQVTLSRLLVPLQTALTVEHVTVFDVRGQPVQRLNQPTGDAIKGPVVEAALAGLNRSSYAATADGLTVVAAAPIKGLTGVVGGVLVATSLKGDDLALVKGRSAVELSLVHGDREVTSTVDAARPDGTSPRGHLDGADDHPGTNQRGVATVTLALPGNGHLDALVPTGDILNAASRRLWISFAVAAGLVLALILFGIALARSIGRPLAEVILAAREMTRGNYRRRITASAIDELNQLAAEINEMAQQLEDKRGELERQAFYDALSGLPNRALFRDRLDQALLQARRSGLPVAVLFMDLDDFKFVNDTHGHHVGDLLILAIADRLRTCVRAADTVARHGGDEFAVLLTAVDDLDVPLRLAQRVHEALNTPVEVQGLQLFASVSIGIAIGGTQEWGNAGREEIMSFADLAMYHAKLEGKGRTEVFKPDMAAEAAARLALEADLRRAIECQEFVLRYQPIVSLSSGSLVGVEALVRWRHPERGLVPPAEFIGLAEQTKLIVPIGRWVLSEACHQASAWHRSAGRGPLIVSVNVSPVQLLEPGLVDEVAELLERSGLPSGSLVLEITETAMMENPGRAQAMLERLRGLGIGIAIDDFGTGHSSLAYLQRLPVTGLKIDKAFTDGLEDEAGPGPGLVKAIVTLGASSGLVVTAEGIETTHQLAHLQRMGCVQGQGYLFSKPVAADEINALLTGRNFEVSESALLGAD